MARKHKHEEHENHERWLVSYADFITLLFAFFVVLFASSKQDAKKMEALEYAIRSSLHVGPMGGGHNLVNLETGAAIAPIIGSFPKDGSPIDLQRYFLKRIESTFTVDEKVDSIEEVVYDEKSVRIRLKSSNLFNPGETKLSIKGAETLTKLTQMMRDSEEKFIIEGHTDDQKVTPNPLYESNWELGAKRAMSVMKFMIYAFKISPDKISAMSLGDSKPIAGNNTPQGRAKNRRIEIVIPSKIIDGAH